MRIYANQTIEPFLFLKGKNIDCGCNAKTTKHDPKIPEPSKSTQPCCPCPCPAEKCRVTLETVKKLVEAENKDIELSELLSGITILDERRPKKKIINMYDATSKNNREETVSDWYRTFAYDWTEWKNVWLTRAFFIGQQPGSRVRSVHYEVDRERAEHEDGSDRNVRTFVFERQRGRSSRGARPCCRHIYRSMWISICLRAFLRLLLS